MKIKIKTITILLCLFFSQALFAQNLPKVKDTSKGISKSMEKKISKSVKKDISEDAELQSVFQDSEGYASLHSFIFNQSQGKIYYALSKDKNNWTVESLSGFKSRDIFNSDSIFFRMKSESGVVTLKTLYPKLKYVISFNSQTNTWAVK